MERPCLLTFGVLLLLGSLPPASAREKDEKELKRLLGDKDRELQVKVNKAVQNGMKCLLELQQPDGSWSGLWAQYKPPHKYPMGETALALLALLKSGATRHDPAVKKGFDWLRDQPLKKTYEVGVLLMALEALYAPKKPPPLDPKELTKAADAKVPVPPEDLGWMKACVEFLLRIRVPSMRLHGLEPGKARAHPDIWHYPSTTGDHSNTQFALLGLKSAAKCGISIPPEVWHNTLLHFIEVQEKTGPEVKRWTIVPDEEEGYVIFKPSTGVPDHARGWCYGATIYPKGGASDPLAATTGSMTCVGISSIAIALSGLSRKCPPLLREKAKKSLWDGIAWLTHNWKVEENPKHPEKRWHFYYLYGLERSGVLTWQRHFGKHDWYREGAEFLVARQMASGGWDCPICPGVINNTCFALLFLTRATVPGKPVISGGGRR
ncbi:MAG: hypothetical protein ACYTHM_17795 [Planctomycetota bacterium]|jgi:hypothetical protein